MRNRDEYQAALKVADLSFEETGEPDLGLMRDFVQRLLIDQLNSIPAA